MQRLQRADNSAVWNELRIHISELFTNVCVFANGYSNLLNCNAPWLTVDWTSLLQLICRGSRGQLQINTTDFHWHNIQYIILQFININLSYWQFKRPIITSGGSSLDNYGLWIDARIFYIFKQSIKSLYFNTSPIPTKRVINKTTDQYL